MAKILIVDDSSFQRKLICKALREIGHESTPTGDGDRVHELIETESPDVILVDLLMPQPDGFEILRRLKQSHCPIPRVVLTADVQETVAARCRELGASEVLHKPPKEATLRDAIERALFAAEAPA